MFVQPQNSFPGRIVEDFIRPVESIMRCEDFKSNFARKLSNRYVSRTPLSPKPEACPLEVPAEKVAESVPERIEPFAQLSKCSGKEQNGEIVRPPDKARSNTSDKRKIEVTALNMEVDTLKWQLAQTEANRQMHIALLKQIVTFLNRVKEQIECKEEPVTRHDTMLDKTLPNSFTTADLPRSRSVLHVNNKNLDYSPSCPKKINGRKISKSISNVNGFKDLNNAWNQSKLSLTSETKTAKKISEEMSRLITLANTVLSTKIPDLINCSDKYTTSGLKLLCPDKAETHKKYGSSISLNRIEENIVSNFIFHNDTQMMISDDKYVVVNDKSFNNNLVFSPPPQSVGLEDGLASIDLNYVEHDNNALTKNAMDLNNEKKVDYIRPTNFIEDESGFSSMSSFQEIGIPIISIIPPSPCKNVGFDEEITDIMEVKEKWKTEGLELDKQTVKVFWV